MIQYTDMMREILKSEVAQRIIDFVSPIYGDSYVALWLYQIIGSALDHLCETADKLRTETNPATAEILIEHWEKHYGLSKNPGLTLEQRQNRVIAGVMAKGPCSPKALADAVSASLLGAQVDVEEHVGKNAFAVNIHEYSGGIAGASAIVDRMKPAHLIYQLRMLYGLQPTMVAASAATHSESHGIEMVCDFYEEADSTTLLAASGSTHSERFASEIICELYEDVEALKLAPSAAVTLNEQHYMEVL